MMELVVNIGELHTELSAAAPCSQCLKSPTMLLVIHVVSENFL